jgi:predicted acyl esterase
MSGMREGTGRWRLLAVALAAMAVVAGACSSDSTPMAAPDRRPQIGARTAAAPWHVQQSVNQLAVTDAPKGATLALFDPTDHEVQRGTADDLGSLIFREVPSGRGYHVQQIGPAARPTSRALRVESLTQSLPPQSFYDGQHLTEGFQYIEARDGTTRAAAVYPPAPIDQGPYPTVVEYSGYSPSNPTKKLSDELGGAPADALGGDGLCQQLTIICKTPDQPASLLASAMGYAVVAVNMRGTGCSGGAYDFFEPLQLTDGYDVIEAVAAQPWVANGKVGMVGLSYPGISQLFVASTQPPHLAAITPLSVYDDTARGVLAPGGIFNSGFALQWARSVLDDATPYGQDWTKTVVAQGDRRCAENQKLRLQNVDAVKKAKRTKTYDGVVADPLNPDLFADRIDVPVFLGCAFQDEQTGGRCARLTGKFTNAPVARYTYYNGAHSDGFAPQVLVEWKAFLDIYVAGKITPINPLLRAAAPQFMADIFGATVPLPPERWTSYPTFDAAKAAYEAEDPVRIIFESGNGAGAAPGAPVGRYEIRTTSFPPTGVRAQAWYLQPDGSLAAAKPPGDGGGSKFIVNPELGDQVTLPGSSENDAFDALPGYQWKNDAPGDADAFLSAPLTETQTYIGTANADLWVKSTSKEADLEVTLSEVRPDGSEMYVQSGWLRGSMRALASDATKLDPNHGDYARDVRPVPSDHFTEAQVEIFPFAHVFRKGSRIRISVHTPGGDRPRWSWILADQPAGTAITVAHDAAHPSRLLLPKAASTPPDAPRQPAPCPSLRGQPCRPFQPYLNLRAD